MRVVRLQTIIEQILKNYIRSAIIIIVFVILFLFLGKKGVEKAQYDSASEVAAYETELEKYNNQLEQYDISRGALEENLSRTQSQYDKQKEYCDNSIYMQLDSSGVYYGQLQMAISTEGNVGNIISSLATYMSGTEFYNGVAEKSGEQSDYLKEVISCTSSANIFIVNVMHYDEEKAKNLVDAVEKTLLEQIPAIKKNQGDFIVDVVSNSVDKRADISILNTQNGNINNLKSYTTALADAQAALIRNESERKTYEQEGLPDPVYPFSTRDLVKTMIKYFILGVFVGAVFLAVFEAFIILFSKHMKNTDYFTSLGVPNMGLISGEDIDGLVEDVYLIVLSSGRRQVYLDGITPSEGMKELLEKVTVRLEEKGLGVFTGTISENNIDVMGKAVEMGNTIAVVEYGKARYDDADFLIERVKRYDQKLLGVVVWKPSGSKQG